ncbi:NAD(P)-binding protein [Lophium mytilinum]|uniref:NAD(P)-binding protein n=1 Tax=Lophium mytilinum TaxID=390894 RepID=A0A6A6RCF9_9PEZI|nr:NAD(P)-binding protein [Lophium mytilinum]
MATIAVAGGTGGIGRAIVQALKVQVDYTDTASLEDVLKSHGIETVISTLAVLTSNEAEINLVSAAEASSYTKRFIPSSWGIAYTEEQGQLFPPAGLKLEVLSKLKKSTLEHTRVNCGFFLDYFGIPKIESFLQPTTIVLDLNNNTAGIPGEGNTPVAFTHTTDVARYVSKLLDIAKWKPDSYTIGDKITWNDFVALAEKTKGVKFNVQYDSIESLQKGQITELPAHVPVYPYFPKEQLQFVFAVFGLWFDGGAFNLHPEQGSLDLNAEFPEIKPLTVKDVLQKLYASS